MLIQIAFAFGSKEYLDMVLLLIIKQKASVCDLSGVCLDDVWVSLDTVFKV